MIYYIRKISRPKWQETPLSGNPDIAAKEINGVSADAITNCLKTTSNKLSLWRVDIESYSIDDIIPLIVGFEKPNTCDVVYIPEKYIIDANLSLEQSQSDANTPIEELKQTHYNVIVHNYAGLGLFSKVVLQSLQNHKRYREKEIKTKLRDLLDNHIIEPNMISPKLYEKVKI